MTPRPTLARTLLIVLVALAAACVWARGRSDGFAAGPETIFVSVASYRDSQCSDTIRDLFAKASDPGRVFVGVCEQNSGDERESCAPAALPKNVRRVQIPYGEAKGPVYARYLCSTLYAGETWFMQIDSHTKFAQGWDALAIADAKKCPSKKPVLTHYPRVMEELDGGHKGVPVLCKSKFDGQGVPTLEAVIMDPRPDGTPRPVPFVSGGFVFAPGRSLLEVPFDPDLPYLFQGEEILHSARLWTAGYDFFTPLHNIVFHQYERTNAPRFWNDIKDYGATQAETLKKVRRVLGLEPPGMPGYRYGMGADRTLAQYWAFAGIDAKARASRSEQKFCAA